MKPYKFTLFALSLSLFFISCDEFTPDEEQPQSPEVVTGEECDGCEFIDLGNQSIIAPPNGSSRFDLDFDADGEPDIRFTASLMLPTPGRTQSSITVEPLYAGVNVAGTLFSTLC